MNVFFVSLGCDKNLVDSEHMLAVLSENGAKIVDDEHEADVIVINTCSFILDAKEESINTIIEMAEMKKSGKCKVLVVTGCLAQRYEDEIKAQLPEVDVILGINGIEEIFAVANEALSTGKPVYEVFEPAGLPDTSAGRIVTTGGHYAYLKIAEGCDKHCTYCAIPSIRGKYRSVVMEELVAEAKNLAESGVKELILVAQETTVYGTDIYGKKKLPELVNRLSEIDGIEWIRILYCYPEEIDEAFVDMMANNKKVCHYIDMPIQHCSNEILGRMGRRTSKADILEKIAMLRSAMPDIAIRTSLICGFPGETKSQHKEMLDFVKKVSFDRLGVFTYSQEENTPAASFKNQVWNSTKKRRRDAIMKLQEQLMIEKCNELKDSEVMCFIEGEIPADNVYVGRTFRDAPDVDGLIFIDRTVPLMSGDIVKCRIKGAKGIDLLGEII